MAKSLARVGALFLFLAACANFASARDRDGSGTVYLLSNETSGNRVLVFARDEYGRLTPGDGIATGGKGSGGGLGSQGALASDGEYLLAVNAGSNDVSVLRIGRRGLQLVDRIPSGGVKPVSVTIDRNLVYVLNAGSDNIAGFWLDFFGRLHALPDSEHGLSGTGTAPAQIQFANDGRMLVVTEKNTDKIDIFSLDRKGAPVALHAIPSGAPTPFGFAVTRHNQIIVSEAAGGATNAGALGSYGVNRDGELYEISPVVSTTQTAACWVVVTRNERFAFTTNTGANTISSYALRGNGDLQLLDAIAGTTGAGPIDMSLSDDDEFLHVLNSTGRSISTFRVFRGTLIWMSTTTGLPTAAAGLIAL